jgi:hypothetical protein
MQLNQYNETLKSLEQARDFNFNMNMLYRTVVVSKLKK